MSKVLLPNALIRVRFLLPEEGGMKSNKTIEWTPEMQTGFGCPMRIGEDLHDFRTLISETTTYILGEMYDLYVKFLCPELVLPKLRKDMEIELWAGKTIAKGNVIEIIHHQACLRNTKANAILQWLRPEAGGRMFSPTGPYYFPTAWFPEFGKKWEDDMWSLRVEITTPPDDTLTHNVKISFLADEAPDYLQPNSLFEVFEGRRLVAKGKVIDKTN